MEVIDTTSDIELRIAYDMVYSTEFLDEFSDKYKDGVLSNRYYSIIAKMCLKFYAKYKEAPADKFVRFFENAVTLGKIKPEAASELKIIIETFKQQEPITDIQFEINEAYNYFQTQIIKLYSEEASSLAESGKLSEAKEVLNSIDTIQPVSFNCVDILTASDSQIDDLF